MGIGDLAAHDADHVGLALGDHLLRVLRRLHTRLGSDAGVLHDLLELRGIVGAQEHAVVEGRHDLRELVEVAAGAAGEVVDEAAAIQMSDDFLLVGDGEAARIGLGAGDGHADDEAVAAGGADAPTDFDREAQAVLEAAAPFVVALVGERRPELVDQAVVAGEKVGAVEPEVPGRGAAAATKAAMSSSISASVMAWLPH